MNTARTRQLSPLALWAGILAGPIAWACDLLASYAGAHAACDGQSRALLFAIAGAALVVVIGGAFVSWRALQWTNADAPTGGGRPLDRARFMAILGLASSALFALQILAGAVPPGGLDACQ